MLAFYLTAHLQLVVLINGGDLRLHQVSGSEKEFQRTFVYLFLGRGGGSKHKRGMPIAGGKT